MKAVAYSALNSERYYMSFTKLSIGKRTLFFKPIDRQQDDRVFTIIEAFQSYKQDDHIRNRTLIHETNYISIVYPDESFYELTDEEVNIQILLPSI